MNPPDRWSLGHRPALDGLRAVAVLAVVVTHFNWSTTHFDGGVGVTLFFVLSGFLITNLLLQERDTSGRTALWRFYLRRGLRLFPGLFAMVAIVSALQYAGLPMGTNAWISFAAVTYWMNWYVLGATHVWNGISHTWSLGIEEQFYILWPLLLIVAHRFGGRRGVLLFAGGGAVASAVWGWVSGGSPLATGISAYPLLLGAAMAAVMHGGRARRPSGWIAVAGLAAILAYAVLGPYLSTRFALLVPLVSGVCIWVGVQRDLPWLSSRPLVWIGRRSYGVYLWHYPISWVLGAYYWRRPGEQYAIAAGLALTYVLTALSWRYVESPFLRIKNRIGDGRRLQVERPRTHAAG